MIWRLTGYLLLMGGLGFLALLLIAFSAVSPKMGVMLVPGLAIGGLVTLNPFAALLLLVTFSHLDALASILSQALPLSAFKLLTVAALGGMLLQGYRKPRQLRLGPASRTKSLVMLFLIWLCISYLTCKFPEAGKDHVIGFASVIVLFFLIVALADTPGRLRGLVWVLVGTGLVSGLFVLAEGVLGVRLVATEAAATTAQFEGQARSAGASNYNPTTAAHMLLCTVVMAAVLFFEHKPLRWFSGAVVLIGMAGLVLTLARSAAIAFALIALVYMWQNRKHRLFPLMLVCLAAAAAAAVPFVPEVYWERMGTIFEQGSDRTLLRRFSYNLIGLQLLWENPVFGVGPGNYPHFYAGDEFRWYPGREPAPRQLHNSYMEIAAELGVVGLALFLGVMLSAMKAALQAVRARVPGLSVFAKALAYGFAAFLIASLFMPNEDTKFMWILPALCVAARQLSLGEGSGDAGAGPANTGKAGSGDGGI
ncbi:O-antigen ligase family protein [Leisingera thetidis]|uniref:O-antigen ligase family protein n=1 Tax=Leisingera thetidis TaxID=2930199 RepID=UPI0021F70146|nr:O-antigen ligase family protein [Leisingera thetidis]